MQSAKVSYTLGLAIIAASAVGVGWLQAQEEADPNAAHNPYRMLENWAQLSAERPWGAPIGVEVDHRDGKSIWVFDRCGENNCTGSSVAPIMKFDPSGKLVANFGAGMFNFPHGLFVDRDGNVWVTDGRGEGGKGHTVIKFAPDGKVLMTLGKPGVAGDGPDSFNSPSDVAVAPNGDIFVADGHDQGNVYGGFTSKRNLKKFVKN
jgi:streptogramin lyase